MYYIFGMVNGRAECTGDSLLSMSTYRSIWVDLLKFEMPRSIIYFFFTFIFHFEQPEILYASTCPIKIRRWNGFVYLFKESHILHNIEKLLPRSLLTENIASAMM